MRRDALLAMVGRTSVPELREMLLAIAQSEQHGLSIGKILRVQTAEIRDKRRARAEEAATRSGLSPETSARLRAEVEGEATT